MNRLSHQGKAVVNSLTDKEVMENVRDGRVERLAILFERYHVTLYNFFLRLTGNRSISEDLVQNVFFRILKYRHTYQGQSKFAIWMYQIARNVHNDYLRKKKDEVPLDEQYEEVSSPELSPTEKMEQSQDIALIREALSKLPLRKREILVLSRYHDLTHKEIAELFGCHIGTVKATIHRATKELGKIYLRLSEGVVL